MELVKINASDYGLEESKAKEIESQFKPMLAKMSELEKEYNQIIKLDINQETCEMAKELRLKYVKVRTGTSEIHKIQKAFYLAGGRFVDGWKNAQLFASQGIEDTLMAIEKHYENEERERITKLQTEREAELMKYQNETIPTLGVMSDEVWNNFLFGTKTNYENRIAAEKKAELDRIEAENKRIAEEKRIREENEKLKKEAEAKEKQRLIEIEKKNKEDEILRKKHESELKIEREKSEEIERVEKEKTEKLRIQLKERQEAEQREINRKLAEKKKQDDEEKAAQLAPDKDKLLALSQRIINIQLPELRNKEAIKILDEVTQLLFKIDSYIKEKVQNI